MSLASVKITTPAQISQSGATVASSVKSASVTLPGPILLTPAGLDSRYVHQDGTGLPSMVEAGISKMLMPSGSDDSAAMATALTSFAPFASPVIKLGIGTFQWNAQVPAFLRATPAVIMGAGEGKTIIQLSSGAPRAFDFNRIADYDLFQKITISHLTVDVNSVAGKHHAVVGTFVSGGGMQRISVDMLTVENVEVINAPVDTTLATSQRIGIDINLHTLTSDEATQIYATRITTRKFKMTGGSCGVFISGSVADASASPNIWIDDLDLEVEHNIGSTPTTSYASAYVQVGGSGGLCGKVRVNVVGANSADVGVEIDNTLDAIVTGVSTDSDAAAFYATNFRTHPNISGNGSDWDVSKQVIRFVDCHAQRLLLASTATTQGRAFGCYDNSLPIGTLIYDKCSMTRTAADSSTTGELFAFTAQIQKVIIRDCVGTALGVNNTGASSHSMIATAFVAGSTPTTFVVRGLQLNVSGVITGGAYTYRGLDLNTAALSAPGVDLDIADVTHQVAVTASGSGSVANMIGIELGSTNFFGRGVIRGLRFPLYGTFSGRIGLLIPSTATLTIDGFVRVAHCDFNNTGTASGIFCSATNVNGAKVLADNTCRWPANDTRAPTGRKPTATDLTMTLFDTLVAVTSTASARTMTLPTLGVVPVGQIFIVVDESNAAGTNNITISRAGSDTFLGGGTTKAISANGGTFKCYSNGTVWVPTT